MSQAETLEASINQLTDYGAEKDMWVLAHCEEDDNDDREQCLARIDYDIECAEEHLAKLQQQADELLKAHRAAAADRNTVRSG